MSGLWFVTFVLGLLGGAGVTVGAMWDYRAKSRAVREEGLRLQAEGSKALEDAHAARRLLARREHDLNEGTREFNARVISYEELVHESQVLKRDLLNLDVELSARRIDQDALADRQRLNEGRSIDLAKRYLSENVRQLAGSLSPNNFTGAKERLIAVVERCRNIGFPIDEAEERQHVADLQARFEEVVRAYVQREEQARIKAQIREEERLQRDAQRAIDQAAKERELVENALAEALARAHGERDAEVEQLQARLAEAEARSQRAMSMAQQTKAGNVYVISNRGSFGTNVFKVGMTRRLEPLDRVRELGDASVPFPFDVHMMIACDDAPALENALHRALHASRMNKVNPRKEFFRTDFEAILRIVREHHSDVQYVATPEALEFNESLTMSDADADYVEQVFDEAEGPKTEVVED